MVACSGKGFALCCIPRVAVSQPVTRYRPNLRNKAVTSNYSLLELLAMIYLLLCVNRTKPTFNTEVVRIQAPNQDEARFKLTADYQMLAVCGRINTDKDTHNLRPLKNEQKPNLDFVKPDENLTTCRNAVLPTNENKRNIESTTNSDGSRSHYPSGIFLPKIHQLGYGLLPHIYQCTELAVRAIPRNKASNRTNNRSRSLSVVESLPHLIKSGNLLTKNSEIYSMKTIQNTATSGIYNRLLAVTGVSARNKGGLYA